MKFTIEDKERCIPYIEQILEFAGDARSKGILFLEDKISKESYDPLYRVMIMMIADGVHPDSINELMNNIFTEEEITGFEVLKRKIIISGMLSVQAGEMASLIELKLASLLGLDYTVMSLDRIESHRKSTLDQFLERRKSSQCNCSEGREFEELMSALDNNGLRQLTKSIVVYQLGCALAFCGYDIIHKIFGVISKGTTNLLIDIIQEGQVSQEESVQAQRCIIDIINEDIASV